MKQNPYWLLLPEQITDRRQITGKRHLGKLECLSGGPKKNNSMNQVKVSLAVMLSRLFCSYGMWITKDDTFSETIYQQKKF